MTNDALSTAKHSVGQLEAVIFVCRLGLRPTLAQNAR